jgi:hypothetical protein
MIQIPKYKFRFMAGGWLQPGSSCPSLFILHFSFPFQNYGKNTKPPIRYIPQFILHWFKLQFARAHKFSYINEQKR